MILLFLLPTLMLATISAKHNLINFENHLSDEFIDHVNSAQNSWIAGQNFHENTPVEYLNKLPGVVKLNGIKPSVLWHHIQDGENLPESFDAREKWPMCESLKEIRDQGDCAGGWAITTAETMTDRVCIHSAGKQNFHFSAFDLLTCCEYECFTQSCSPGDIYAAWSFFETSGIVSGGNYNSTYKGCKPYLFQTCYHDEDPHAVNAPNNLQEIVNCSDVIEPHYFCSRLCDPDSHINYLDDKKLPEKVYVISNDENQIRKEIYKNGPVVAGFVVYSDFLSYKNGVYKHVAGKKIGDHAVKILGWGIENNTKYWLAANSWHDRWGEKGFFKILRGENHCGVEEDIITGLPSIDDTSIKVNI